MKNLLDIVDLNSALYAIGYEEGIKAYNARVSVEHATIWINGQVPQYADGFGDGWKDTRELRIKRKSK